MRLMAGDAVAAGLDRVVEVLVGDHQNKPDIGSTMIRDWMAVGSVNVVMDV